MAADGHHLADYIPQSTVRAEIYGLLVATYPAARFIDARVFLRDQRATLPASGHLPPAAELPAPVRWILIAALAAVAIAAGVAAYLAG